MKKLKRVLVTVITLAAITAPVAGYAQTATVKITEPSNIMCQVAGSSDAVNLTWWTPYSTNSAYVEDSSSPENRDYKIYEAQISELLPDTDYYYRVSEVMCSS